MSSHKENTAPVEVKMEQEQEHVHGPNCSHGHGNALLKPITREAPKVGRNDPCPCGSQKKFKKCCGI
ncbi:MAG: SEC-C domain-containing protein [Bacteriovorax sp.]|nr:SEC-C domain-containing protein [Bacteriovorax sp.]